jgi:hypothetical protein
LFSSVLRTIHAALIRSRDSEKTMPACGGHCL